MPSLNNNGGGHVPWWMFDIDNLQLFTSANIPSDIADNKNVVLTEVPIPGSNHPYTNTVGGESRKISFKLPLVQRDPAAGNVFMLKAYDSLRNQTSGFLKTKSGPYDKMPRVLYNWGTGSIPLIWFVTKASMVHKQGWVNEIGLPMYSEIDIELVLDETSPIYRGEEIWREYAALVGNVSMVDVTIGEY